MVSSGPLTILCILLLLSPVALAQNVADKAATSTISGKVTVGGKGLQGVVVALVISEQHRSIFRPTRFRSTTDQDGNYRITNVTPGNYEVIVASPAYVPTEDRKSLIVGKNETLEDINITLERGGVITGRVTDAEGRPVIEEMVYVSAATTAQRLAYFRNFRTDDRGIYRAYGVPAGKYKVFAGRDPNSSFVLHPPEGEYQRRYHPSAIDPAAAFVIDVSEGSEATNVDITLGGPVRTYSARGRIIDSDTDRPMPNMRVGMQLLWQHGTGAVGGVAESNKDGEFKVEKLAPGKYAVYSESPDNSNWHSEAVKFEVTDRDVDGLVIKVSGGASVSGVVILEGAVDPKLRANLFASRIVGRMLDGYLGQSASAETINPNGSFRITGVAAGRLVLDLEPREHFRVSRVERDGIVYPRGVEVKEREHVTGLRVVVAHANGGIRGAIRRPNGLEPAVARVQVTVTRNEDFYGVPVEVDVLGQFRVNGLIPGTYEILVHVFSNAPNVQPQIIPPTRHTVEVTNGAVTDVNITLQMPKPAQ